MNSGQMLAHRGLLFILGLGVLVLIGLLIAGCSTPITGERTTADERLAISAETAYRGSVLVVKLKAARGIDRDEAVRLATLDDKAFTAVCKVRRAYNLLNPQLGRVDTPSCAALLGQEEPGDYEGAHDEALAAVAEVLTEAED